MKFLFYIAIIFTALLTAAQAQTINLSQSGAPVIDGKIDEKEWQNASAFDLSGGGKIYFARDGEFLYVGVRGVKAGWSHLYLSEGEAADVSVIHASAALGKSVYRQDAKKLWQPANEFSWELRDRVITAETQKKMSDYLAKNNWVASNNNMGNPTEIEFKLKPQNAANKLFRVAIVYVADGVNPQFFPATLADDTLKNSRLLQGYTPPDVKFDFSGWAKINFGNPATTLDKNADEKSAAEIADKLFAAMQAKNFEAIRALFTETGQLIAVDKPRSGQGISTRRVFTADAFAKAIAEAKVEFIEKMPEKNVTIDGDFALVYGRYTFYAGGKFSHCGVNSFQLVRTESGWRIANAASTLEFDCK